MFVYGCDSSAALTSTFPRNPGGVLAWGNARQGGVAPSSADVARRGQVFHPKFI